MGLKKGLVVEVEVEEEAMLKALEVETCDEMRGCCG